MSDFDRQTSTLYEEPVRRRPGGSRFGELGGRLARTFGGYDRTQEEPQWDAEEDLEYSAGVETEAFSAQATPFPISRNGYDPAAVEQRVAELERELDRLRGSTTSKDAVAAEIERVGQQTSAILLIAHERAQEITRQAQEQADRCVADAAANAVQMTASAKRKLSDLDTETDSVWQERARLLEDARNVATALFTLVEEAEERFPGEAEKAHFAKPVAAPVGPLASQLAPAAEPHADEQHPDGVH
jgi:cell division septum initiation protein DivIVA